MTKTTRIVCLCILGAGIFYLPATQNSNKQSGLGILSTMGIMGNLSKQQNTHSTQNTQLNLTTLSTLSMSF